MHDLDDELLTVAEIAATLKLNRQTIRNWIDEGRIPHVRVGQTGRRVRVFRSDFQAFIAAAEPASVSAEPPGSLSPSIWDGLIPPPSLP